MPAKATTPTTAKAASAKDENSRIAREIAELFELQGGGGQEGEGTGDNSTQGKEKGDSQSKGSGGDGAGQDGPPPTMTELADGAFGTCRDGKVVQVSARKNPSREAPFEAEYAQTGGYVGLYQKDGRFSYANKDVHFDLLYISMRREDCEAFAALMDSNRERPEPEQVEGDGEGNGEPQDGEPGEDEGEMPAMPEEAKHVSESMPAPPANDSAEAGTGEGSVSVDNATGDARRGGAAYAEATSADRPPEPPVLRAGCYGVLRDGRTIGPFRASGNLGWPFMAEIRDDEGLFEDDQLFRADGTFHHIVGVESPFDVVRVIDAP